MTSGRGQILRLLTRGTTDQPTLLCALSGPGGVGQPRPMVSGVRSFCPSVAQRKALPGMWASTSRSTWATVKSGTRGLGSSATWGFNLGNARPVPASPGRRLVAWNGGSSSRPGPTRMALVTWATCIRSSGPGGLTSSGMRSWPSRSATRTRFGSFWVNLCFMRLLQVHLH